MSDDRKPAGGGEDQPKKDAPPKAVDSGLGTGSTNRDKDRSPDSRTSGSGSRPTTNSSNLRRSSTSPSGGSGSGSRSPNSPRSPRSGGTGSPRDLSPPLLQELASMNVKTIARRPNIGTQGRPVRVRSNFYEISVPPPDRLMVIQYHVDMVHPSPNRKLDKDEMRVIFWAAINDNRAYFPNKYRLAYDGAHQMYATRPIEFPDDRSSMKLDVEVSLPKDPRAGTIVVVTFAQVSTVLMDLSKARVGTLDERVTTPVQVLDIIFRQSLNFQALSDKANFYPFKSSFYRIPRQAGAEAMDLGGGKQLWTGFFTSITIATNSATNQPRALLNVDVSHSAFYKPKMMMTEFMCDVLNEKAGGAAGPPQGGGRGGRGGGRGGYQQQGQQHSAGPYSVQQLTPGIKLAPHEHKVVAEAVKGLKVRITHREGVTRVYRVNALVDSADSLSFMTDAASGQTRQTVAAYFSERYGALRFPRLPCLHVGPLARNIYFPIEVCELDSPLKYPKKLNDRQTSAVIRAAATPAPVREQRIQSLMDTAEYGRDQFLSEYGVSVSHQMTEMQGRVLNPPPILYNQRSQVPVVQPRDGAWDSITQMLFKPATCKSFSLIALVPPREEAALQDFCHKLHRKATEMGLQFPQWPECVKYARSKEDIATAYKEIEHEHNAKNLPCDMVFVVMPGKNSDQYMMAKECSDMNTGIMSQCILFKNASRLSPATASNFVLKVNAKLGGINNTIQPDDVASRYLCDASTLVLGIDVTHPTLMEEKAGIPSIAAVVGNVDGYPQCWGANVKVQKKSRESVVYLLDCVRERLVSFYRMTGRKPERILVYRDGVSEGQFLEVLREEMQGIRTACLMLSPEYRPPITYIVVQKRHHARFFCSNQRDAVGKCKNVPPGLCVDTDIVSPDSFDFYLCSHFGIQGTSRPTRYCVLWDEVSFKADELQSLTYQLCHMYCRCPRSVSVPAPVYYADLVATRARCHIKRRLGVHDSDSMSDAGSVLARGSTSTAPTSARTNTTGTTTTTNAAAKRTGRGRGQPRDKLQTPQQQDDEQPGLNGGGGGSGSSDSGLQECVNVVDRFKQRMYFV